MAKLDHAKRVLKYEIFGLFLLVLGLVTLGDLGAVGQSLDDLCIMLAGNWHFLIPLYLLWVALIVMIRRHRFRFTSFQVGILILGMIVLAWSELDLYAQAVRAYGGGAHADLLHLTQIGINSLTQSLHVVLVSRSGVLSPENAGGGMVGYTLFTGLKYLFAVTGTLLVLVAALLVAAILITRKSLVATIERASHYFEQRFDRGWARSMRVLARALGSSADRSARRKAAGGARFASGTETAEDGVPAEQAAPVGEPSGDLGPQAAGARPKKRAGGLFSRRGKAARRAQREADAANGADDVGLDGAPADVGAQDNSFPFPDFGAAFAPEPAYEDFFSAQDAANPDTPEYGAGEMGARGVAGPETSGASGAAFELDEGTGRLRMKLPPSPRAAVIHDPPRSLPSGGPQGATDGEPGGAGAKPYRLPDARILDRGAARRTDGTAADRELQANARKLQETMESFGVQVKVLGFSRGPAVTRYEIQPAMGVKVARVVSLSNDLALALAARDIRMEAPIPGKSAIGIEVPNREISLVTFREVTEAAAFQQSRSLLTVVLGKDIAGNTIVGDLAKMPHILVAGATGSGKSVCINSIIASILFRAKPDEVKFIMIDPKMVELGVYSGIPHMFSPVVTEARRAAAVLRKVIAEMEHRYELFHGAKVRDLEHYNAFAGKNGKPVLPLIVVIIDELADLMMVAPGDVEDAICRLAQMARASGIHLVVATQRPSVDVITGLIKSNIPSRIAFAVSSGVDSRTILDGSGADKLLGRGDMLYLPVGAPKPLRVQGAFLSEAEVERLVEFVKGQQDTAYVDDLSQLTDERAAAVDDLDALFDEAVKLVVETGQASTSFIQRRLRVGYSRAARLVDSLEQMGIIGPFDNSKPREVLLSREEWLNRQSEGSG